ncbi:hypothetical protein [Streptomyces sp. KR55]|uniref:hypothetical protein n=1 Tax=Streptomyces sp. KR55 TaxID=3457425 RepID=UPI003FD1DC8D
MPTRLTGMPRPRRLPYLLLGALLVLGCATAGVLVGTQLGYREAVLVLARPVSVGQQLSARDLREISVSADNSLETIPARSRSTVEGRPIAYSLPEGALLTTDVLGRAQVPPAGQAVAAVGLKAGQFPPGLQPGNRVTVVVASSGSEATGSATSSSSSWEATVIAVESRANEQTTVVSLQMDQGDARRLAAAPEGQISVVVVHGGGQ